MAEEKFNLLEIKNDIKWHLDKIKDEYKQTLGNIEVNEITENKIVVECYPKNKLSDAEQSGMEDTFLEDYYLFLSKHHPEVRQEQVKLIINITESIENHWCSMKEKPQYM